MFINGKEEKIKLKANMLFKCFNLLIGLKLYYNSIRL